MTEIQWFTESPDAGPDCTCSLCGQPIEDAPDSVPIRVFNTVDNTEARFHPACFQSTQPLSEEEALALFYETFSEEQNIALKLNGFQAFTLIGMLQLVTRHPGLSDELKTFATDFGRNLQKTLVESCNNQKLNTLIEQGWHSQYDIPQS